MPPLPVQVVLTVYVADWPGPTLPGVSPPTVTVAIVGAVTVSGALPLLFA